MSSDNSTMSNAFYAWQQLIEKQKSQRMQMLIFYARRHDELRKKVFMGFRAAKQVLN